MRAMAGRFSFALATAAFAVFMLVKAMNAAESKLSLGLQPDAPPPEEVLLLREIRDSLKRA